MSCVAVAPEFVGWSLKSASDDISSETLTVNTTFCPSVTVSPVTLIESLS